MMHRRSADASQHDVAVDPRRATVAHANSLVDGVSCHDTTLRARESNFDRVGVGVPLHDGVAGNLDVRTAFEADAYVSKRVAIVFMKYHIVTDDSPAYRSISSQSKLNAPIAIDDIVVFDQDVFHAPEMHGLFRYMVTGAGNRPKHIPSDDPVSAAMAVYSPDVILRANAGGVFEQTILDQAVKTRRQAASR